jgi:hypothetical protein
MSSLSLSMSLSMYVSMHLSLANEREKEWRHRGFLLIIKSRTHHIFNFTKSLTHLLSKSKNNITCITIVVKIIN